MNNLNSLPTSLDCGFCGASVEPVEWHQLESLSVAHGLCGKCFHMVISVVGPSGPRDAFLDWLESVDFPVEQDTSQWLRGNAALEALGGAQ